MSMEFISELGPRIVARAYEHLTLTFLAMLIAVSIAVPTGIFLARTHLKAVSDLIMGIVNVIQPIPSLALVAFTVALFNVVGLPTIGLLPGLVSLVAYALLPILRNTYTGIRQVEPAVSEVAVGMGMTPMQVLFRVQLPLALPVIMAGVRISTVWTIGVATLVSLVGAGGLGDLIFKGLRSYHMDLVLAGAAPAAIMALVLDWALGFTERWLSPGTSGQA
ncbi:MAG: ABC transporter permease subunit [Chitinivibrionales bacterium]|nr:ABC transporter permease subunit [Chitinivibrionales bacterium]